MLEFILLLFNFDYIIYGRLGYCMRIPMEGEVRNDRL
jgi:hypothetical protein